MWSGASDPLYSEVFHGEFSAEDAGRRIGGGSVLRDVPLAISLRVVWSTHVHRHISHRGTRPG